MRILMVTPYPPLRDGIANYAVQMVTALEDEGHEVEVLSPGPSAAHHHLDLHSGARGALALAKRARRYDRLVIQWHPVFFYASKANRHRIEVDLGLLAAFRASGDVEVWVHEFEYEDAIGPSLRARVARALWRAADRLHFHSGVERDQFLAATRVDAAKATLSEHGATFRKRTPLSREQARASLGFGADECVFLAIGFVQRHKGFDRAVRAFTGLAERGASLHIVGSTRIDDPAFVAYLEELEQLVHTTPGAHLHKGYVSDELFDRWILASDYVVLPYREIWSSGVLERAMLYDRPVIATNVGGLVSQATGRNVVLVDDDEALRDEMRKAVGLHHEDERAWPTGASDLWGAVQAEVVGRAEQARGYRRAESVLVLDGGETLRIDADVPLLQLGHCPPPARRGMLARLGRRSADEAVAPVADYANRLRDATLTAIRLVANRHDGSSSRTP